MNSDLLRIYIHIPFCIRKCGYCDFLSFPAGEDTKPLYIRALKKEMRARLSDKRNRPVSSVYFGGGTPSVLAADQLAGILDEIRSLAAIMDNAEITLEANPCTLDSEKAAALKNAGFNRISLGAQSMNDSNLKILGRLHDKEIFGRAFDHARKAGFDNINIDMIAGLPGQSADDWKNEIEEACGYGSEHISAYTLELYENTPLYREKDKYAWPPDDTLADMYELTGEVLAGHGYMRYELSNYAKPGYESRHNTGYWTGDEYSGFGIGAASFEKGTRFANIPDMEAYLKNSGDPGMLRTGVYELSEKDLETEYMILGLRLTRGVSIAGFEERFGESMFDVFGDVLEKYIGSGFMEEEDGRVRLAEKALFVSNSILAGF